MYVRCVLLRIDAYIPEAVDGATVSTAVSDAETPGVGLAASFVLCAHSVANSATRTATVTHLMIVIALDIYLGTVFMFLSSMYGEFLFIMMRILALVIENVKVKTE